MSGPNDPYDPKEVAALSPDTLDGAVGSAQRAFQAATDLESLATVKPAHLGDRSPVRLAKREIGALPPAARSEVGKRVGATLAAISAAYDERLAALRTERDERMLVEETVDVTVPVERIPPGARHPLTTLTERMVDVFVGMGYEVAEGPEIEAGWYNFDALNFPPEHPARELMDTFYVDLPGSDVVLRTHTSPVQIRALLDRLPPVYVVAPGKVFRTDELDATHTPVFHHIEGLVVDRGITMAHLRGTLEHLAVAMFGPDLGIRWRPHFFPFTEPSAEFDLRCFVCRGESVGNPERPCRTCKSQGWIEWGGCGMVNPRVLTAGGVDPQCYTGFAFGMGVERTLMFRHGVQDMRDMTEGDVRFTAAFGTAV